MILCTLAWSADRKNAIVGNPELLFDPQDFYLETGHLDGNTQQMKMTNMCHASSIAEPENGTFVTVFYAGSGEGNSDQEIWMCKKVGNGTWSAPRMLTYRNAGSMFNPVLFQPKDKSKPLALYWRPAISPGQAWVVFSDDAGETWYAPPNGQKVIKWEDRMTDWGTELPSTPRPLPRTNRFLGPIKAVPFELPDGTILFGSSTETCGNKTCWEWHVEIASTNNYYGGTWDLADPGFQGIQPTFLQLSQDAQHLKVLLRDGKPAESTDGGRTWTQLSSGFQSAVAIAAITLPNGWHVAVTNQGSGRGRLVASVSSNSNTWEEALTVNEIDGYNHSYPFMILGSDGNLHLTWSWRESRGGDHPKQSSIKYMVIDPYVLTGGTTVNHEFFRSNPHSIAEFEIHTLTKNSMELNIPQRDAVKLTMHDIQGRLVHTLIDRNHTGGILSVNLPKSIVSVHKAAIIKLTLGNKQYVDRIIQF